MNNDETQEQQNDDEIMLVRDIAALDEYKEWDKYPMWFPVFDEALGWWMEDGDLVIISGLSWQGKCHWKWTKIMMFDWSIKNVENIVVWEKLMWDDWTPRNVLSLARWREELFNINDIKWNTLYTVNKSHILSLKLWKLWNNPWLRYEWRLIWSGDLIDIPLTWYLNSTKSFKRFAYWYRVWIDFSEQPISIDPYFLWLWLWDWTSAWPQITTADKEIVDYIYWYAEKLNLQVRVTVQENNKSNVYNITRKKEYPAKPKLITDKKIYEWTVKFWWYWDILSMKWMLKELNLINNKHIPDKYKYNTRWIRIKVLEWLIDSDWFVSDNCCTIIQKSKVLAYDILYLAMSLWLWAKIVKRTKTIKSTWFSWEYYSVTIYWEMSILKPLLKRKEFHNRLQKKDPLVYSIYPESIWEWDYYWFEIDGNHRYLLWDFSVTHNTTLAQMLAINSAEQWFPVLFLSYEVMVHHLWNKFKMMNMNEELPIFSIKKHTTGNVEWIEKKIKEAKEKALVKVVVIDHLWFLIPRQRTESIASNQAAFVWQIVRELKTLAKDERVIIILPVHVRKTDDPGMNDLKDSSAISQESDVIIIVNREKNPLEGVGDYYTDHTIIKMVKNRKTWVNAQGWFQLIGWRFVHDSFYVPMPKPQRSIRAF